MSWSARGARRHVGRGRTHRFACDFVQVVARFGDWPAGTLGGVCGLLFGGGWLSAAGSATARQAARRTRLPSRRHCAHCERECASPGQSSSSRSRMRQVGEREPSPSALRSRLDVDPRLSPPPARFSSRLVVFCTTNHATPRPDPTVASHLPSSRRLGLALGAPLPRRARAGDPTWRTTSTRRFTASTSRPSTTTVTRTAPRGDSPRTTAPRLRNISRNTTLSPSRRPAKVSLHGASVLVGS